MIFPDYEEEERERLAWALGDYVDSDCPRCGRHRLCECQNGMHRCEKCNWVPELSSFCPVDI